MEVKMYQMRKLKIVNTLAALIAMTAAGNSNGAATQVFSYPNGFSGAQNAIRAAWEAAYAGSRINLTPLLTQHQAGEAWYTTQQDISSFTTDFTFQTVSILQGGVATEGITFAIQNTNSSTDPDAYGTNAGADSNLSGYGTYASQTPIANSIAIKFDISGANGQNGYPANHVPGATGLYINGGPAGGLVPESDVVPSGVNLQSGHVMAVHLVYDGSILTMTLRDTSTNAQYRTSWPVNIPAIVGGNKAWIGFTGGTIPVAAQEILTWSFSEGYASQLSAPTFSIAPGLYSSAQSVSLNGPSGSTIYYTTNGRAPTTSSTKYTGPISVNSSEVVQAVAVASGYTDSPVGVGNYQIGGAGTPLINLSNGLNPNLVTANGSAQFNGSSIALTDGSTGGEAGSAWYVVPVNVQTFSTNFTVQLSSGASGMTFAIQNQPAASLDTSILHVSGGPNTVANNGTGFGYSGITNGALGAYSGLLSSVAVKLAVAGNSTGLFTNGATNSSQNGSISGVNLGSGNPLSVSLTYDGSTLKMTIVDTKSGGSYSQSWGINIPSTVGGTTAYVGFTAGTGWSAGAQNLTAWTYSTSTATVTVPSAPTNLRVQ
jgi:hypothetical protein